MKWLALVNRYRRDRRSLGYTLEADGKRYRAFRLMLIQACYCTVFLAATLSSSDD